MDYGVYFNLRPTSSLQTYQTTTCPMMQSEIVFRYALTSKLVTSHLLCLVRL